MKPRSNLKPHVGCVALGALLPAFAFAQTAPTSATKPAAPTTEETVQLSAFTVTAEDDQGYYSPNAVSGTRTKTELINLPMNLAVLNEEFLKDIGATDLVDAVVYAGGAVAAPATSGDTAQGDTTGFSIRGFGSHLPYRNGFRRVRIVDTTNVSRIEVIKGPSSVLYGTAFAGGSINYITKRPVQKRIADVTLRAGSYDQLRAETDINVPIIKNKLAFRAVGAIEDSDSWTARMHTDLTMYNPSLTYWFRPGSYVTVEYEKTQKSINGYRGQLPYHPLIDFQTAGYPIDETWNTHAAGDYMDHAMRVFTTEAVHQFNRNFTLRANYTRETWHEISRRNGDQIGYARNSAYDAAPTTAPLRLDARQLNAYAARGSWDTYYQAELLNNFSIKGVDSQTLMGAQRSVETFRSKFAATSPGTTAGGTRAAVNWRVLDPSTWVVTEETEAQTTGWNANNQATMGRSRFDTVYVTNQLSFLKGRVRTLAGYRIDKFKSDGHGPSLNTSFQPITPVWNQQSLPHYETPQYGILFKPRENVSVFAQYSESVVNLFLTQQRREDGTRFMPTPGRGEGYDIGFKADFMGGKISLTSSVFKIDNANIVRILATRPDPESPGLTFTPADQGGAQRSEGFDVDARLRLYKGNQVILGFANVDAYVLESTETVTINGVSQLTRQGHQLANAPKRSGSIWVRQDLGNLGGLKNIWVGAGARFTGNRATSDTYRVYGYSSFTLNPGQTAIAGNGGNVNFIGGQLVEPWRLQSYTIFDLSTGARFQLGKVRYNMAFSLKNITDERYLVQRFHFGAPRTWEFRLTTSF